MKAIDDLKAKWGALDPKDQRKYMLIAIVAVALVLAIIINESKQKELQSQQVIKQNDNIQTTRVVSPTVADVGVDDLSGQTQSQLEQQRKLQNELLVATKDLRNDTAVKTESLKQEYSELAQNMAQIQDELRVMRLGQEGSPVNNVGGIQLPALEGIDSAAPNEANQPPKVQGNVDQAYHDAAIEAAGLKPQNGNVTPDDLIHPTPQAPKEAGLQIIKKPETKQPVSTQHKAGIVERTNAQRTQGGSVQQRILQSHILPTGSMIDGVLVSGIDAATGRGSSSPVPALIRVKANAILPNRYSQDVRECFILVSGVGDLARERALIRTEKISCIFKDGRVIDTGLSGYVVGEDGKAGLRGRVVSKQGSIIAKSVFASFLEGFGSSLRPSRTNSLDISGSSNTQYQQTQLKDAFEAGSYDGVSEGFKRAADYYMDLAEQMFPIIEVDAGRKVTVILTNSLNARFSTVDELKATQAQK